MCINNGQVLKRVCTYINVNNFWSEIVNTPRNTLQKYYRIRLYDVP